jgi:ABC-type lipoprotein export system ATPase subunit
MIRVQNLTFGYRKADEKDQMQFPDFSIEAGQHCLLLGESGCGKTTLLHLIGGLLTAKQGTIEIDGVDIVKLSSWQLDRFRGIKMGFIFQKNHLLSSLTVKENLLVASFLAGKKRDEERAIELLSELGISDKINANVTELSYGQAQRVSIARALINKPTLLIADEPTSALDDKNCEKVIKLLLKMANQSWATLLVATHDQRLKDRFEKQIELKSI